MQEVFAWALVNNRLMHKWHAGVDFNDAGAFPIEVRVARHILGIAATRRRMPSLGVSSLDLGRFRVALFSWGLDLARERGG